ncbi:MAG: diguanylate cyclase [Armatimonadetes bacterium]|nr:diguanylate cyclase [Armatimonadota bacterium]
MSARILVVDDEPSMLELLDYVLSRGGYEVTCASGGLEALAKLERVLPHLIVSDVMMPDLAGSDLCQRVRQTTGFELVPFVFLSARGQHFELAEGLELGADDYIPKPFDREELLARVQTALRRARAYQRAAHTDTLTELGDREHFEDRLREELYRQQRYGISSSLALVAIDVATVEAVEEQYGSAAGDILLRRVGRFLRENVRALDVPTRYSESGFIVLMPHTSRDRAVVAIERLSERLNALCIEVNGVMLPILANFGVAIVDREIADLGEMLARAQHSMMQARGEGSTGTVVWSDEHEDA